AAHGVAADLVARERVFVEQQHPQPVASHERRRRRAARPGSHHNDIVHKISWPFSLVARKRHNTKSTSRSPRAALEKDAQNGSGAMEGDAAPLVRPRSFVGSCLYCTDCPFAMLIHCQSSPCAIRASSTICPT